MKLQHPNTSKNKKLKQLKYIFYLLSILNFLIANPTFAQEELKTTQLNQEQLDAYKIDRNIYNFWWNKNSWHTQRGFPNSDSLSYFVDEREYKGIVNYGIEYSNVDRTNHIYVENFKMYNFHVHIDNFTFNSKESIINITGSIENGWFSKDIIWTSINGRVNDNSVKIYVGQRKYTVSKLYYVPIAHIEFPDKYIIKYKGNKITTPVIIDSFPSFYIGDYTPYQTKKGDDRKFEITAKVDRNSILTFGLENCYSEIFEVGKLVFDTDLERRRRINEFKKKRPTEIDGDFKFVIRDNVQELYKDTITIPELPWYYKTVETAEDLIINKQYAKAKDEYNKLLKDQQYVFARDMHNAVRTSILSRDDKTAILWCERLALKGVPMEYYNSQIFKRLKNSQLWQAFKLDYPNLKKQYEDGLNQNLKSRLAELVAMDQKDYQRQAKGEFERSKLNETTQRVDNELIQLIKQEGFPTEERVGIEIIEDTLISKSHEYYALINHSHQVNSDRLPEIQNIINESAQKLEYDAPRNNLNKFMKMGTCFMLYKGNLYIDKNCTVNKKELQKIKFIFQNKYGFVLDEGDLSEVGFSKKNEKEDEEFMEERFNLIEKVRDEWVIYDY